MVCVSCNVNTPAARLLPGYLHPPPLCGGARLSLHELICRPGGLPALEPPRRRRRRRGRRYALHLCCDVSATGPNAAPTNFNPPQPPQQLRQRQQLRSSLFPGGFRRPEIRVPTVVLKVDAADVLQSKGAIDEAVSRGFVGIVLLRGGDDSDGQLYEAACVLRSVVRDRAYFLIAERVDVAAAVGATGVVLSDQGLPVIVARNMLMNSKADSVLLPIVARDVQSAFSAMTAAASEGADFLIFGIDKNNYAKILEGSIMMQNVKVPIFVNIIDCFGEDSPSDVMPNLLRSDASGLVLSLDDVKMLSYDMSSIFSPAQAPDMRLQNESQCSHNYNAEDDPQEKSLVAGFSKLDDKEIKLIEAERSILLEAVAVIRKAAPLMREVSLLEDAVARLDQPFMMVIVGEFNSGKSTVINALLGRRYLAEGVVPTTNEITLLSYSEMEESERCETHPDGQFICYLPAPILKEINLVDTPGTNVILQRQQRLTEEFVPRADLVVFVLSSDRPLTESEVAFLLYMEQWKKKVIFVLNKSDLYRDTSELEEAVMFVKENARRLLNKEDVTIYPVSARSALEAKLSVSSDTGRDSENLLLHDSRWVTSGFYELENFLFSFLDGSTDTGMERMKLKLDTPIGIAERLLSSCETQVKHEYHCATKDLASMNDLVSSVNDYAIRMENESMSWMKRTVSLVETAKNRATELIESTLQLSNIELITTYAIKGERSGSLRTTSAIQNEIISPALSEAQTVVRDYLLWLQSNAIRENQHYLNSFEKRWSGFFSVGNLPCSESFDLMAKGEELSIKVTDNFSSSAAAKLFDQEIREVVLGTFGALGVAGLSASLLTSVLPTTLEDLLALTFCSTGGLLAISNFPTRRKETVEKVRKVADSFTRELEAAMQEDLARTIESLRQSVAIISKPYQEGAQHRINGLLSIQEELTNVEQRLQSIKIEIQNLHVS